MKFSVIYGVQKYEDADMFTVVRLLVDWIVANENMVFSVVRKS